jgi:hypothetical protein
VLLRLVLVLPLRLAMVLLRLAMVLLRRLVMMVAVTVHAGGVGGACWHWADEFCGCSSVRLRLALIVVLVFLLPLLLLLALLRLMALLLPLQPGLALRPRVEQVLHRLG